MAEVGACRLTPSNRGLGRVTLIIKLHEGNDGTNVYFTQDTYEAVPIGNLRKVSVDALRLGSTSHLWIHLAVKHVVAYSRRVLESSS